MNKRKILVTLESRATYGYTKNVMNAMMKYSNLDLFTLVTGMHLVPELGNSIDLIKKDGFPVSAKVPLHGGDKGKSSWSRSLGRGIEGIAAAYEKINPDIVLLSGDRIETFGCCVAAAYMNIPIAHIQAGDKSGHIDDSARHAIGKFSHIHLASCEDSANRLRKMGEQEFRIFNVGAPQLDNIVNQNYESKLVKINNSIIKLSEPYILIVQHPVLVEEKESDKQIKLTIESCLLFNIPIVIIYPNSDLGYGRIVAQINKYSHNNNIIGLSNVDREDYLKLLANCSALVGNSSSGILEAPSFKTPVVNIGNRQRGRQQSKNIINCRFSKDEIIECIDKALNSVEFHKLAIEAKNPYGDGNSSNRICDILESIEINKNLLDKECTY
jgi:GDP/UDP-N,N'-diacetylbacillosamine 2-epimerase (hydrolysing)